MTIIEFIFIFFVLAIVSFLVFGIVEDYLIIKAGEKNLKTINDFWESYKVTKSKEKEVPNATFIYEKKEPVLKPRVKITSAANVEVIYDYLQDLKKYDAYKKDMDEFLATGEGKLSFYFKLIDDKKGTTVTYNINELSEDLGGALLAAIDDHFEAIRESISRYVDGV